MIAAVAGVPRMAVTWMARVTVGGMTGVAVREVTVRGSAVGDGESRQAKRED